ncbi:MAG: cyclase family protein [Gemmatimonadetes bacterium]|nr:cyclase family protein [Gemmatimonadota bacterium]
MTTNHLAIPVLGALLALGACQKPPSNAAAARQVFGNGMQWIDLTHPFSSQTIYWPTAKPFSLEVVANGVTPDGYFYAANNISAAEHGGTHLDAPIHFAQGHRAVDAIPVRQLIGPAAVVDVRDSAGWNPDYLVTVRDFERWESGYGRIEDGAIVLIRTGWAQHWSERRRYLGTPKTGSAAVAELHFPGLDPEAARWLVRERRISAIGLDTPSIDRGQSRDYLSHRILFEADIPAFENVASLDALPHIGGYVIALPMKIGGGSGGPLRIVAAIPR